MPKTSKLIQGALLIAISVVLTRFFSIKISVLGVDSVRLGFGTIPIILAGLRGGPWEGAKVGALADVVGYLLSPGGMYMPHFTLASALMGALPSLLVGKKNMSHGRLFLAVAATYLVVHVLLVSYFLHVIFGIPYEALILPRIISCLLNTFALSFILTMLYRLNIYQRPPAIKREPV